MAVNYLRLFPATTQFELPSGAINVGGRLYVYYEGTDDLAPIFDENGTQLPQPAILDANGRSSGLLVDDSRTYWLKVCDRYDSQLFTIRKMSPCGGGTGSAVLGIDIESSDGTVVVDKYNEGSITHYDLSTDVSDSTELLEWVTCSGSTVVPTNIYRPTFVDGTMELGDYGVRLAKDQYYHVTAHITCTKSGTAYPFADDIQVHFKGRDNLTGNYAEYQLDTVNVDYSTLLPETMELSLDIKPSTDVELVIVIDNSEVTGASFSIKDLQVHRVYSGAPHIPGGVQTKLIAGSGITIQNNVISATGGGGGSGNVDVFAIDSTYVEYSTGATIITGESWSAFKSRIDGDIASGVPMVIVFSSISHHVDGSNAVYYGAMDGNNDWEYTFTSGPNTWGTSNESKTFVLAKYNDDYSDDRMTIEVKTLDIQPKLTAGDGINIVGNAVSVKTDGSTVTFNSSGQLEAIIPSVSGKADKVTGATNGDLASLDSNGNLVDSGIAASSVATTTDLANYQEKLTAGSNISIDSATNTISATDTTYTFSTGLTNSSGTITVDTTVVQPKLTAGSNISIDPSTNTISASQPDISGKADKVTGATNGDLASLDSNGNLVDSGIAASSVATTTDLAGYQEKLTAGSNISIDPSTNTISATDTTYSAGNMISISNNSVGVSTTAGITDVQYVNALPANPVATVLYLIPET